MANRAVLVTGASRGIGKATALRISEAGYSVGINYRESLELAERMFESIKEAGGEALLLQADVGSEEEVNTMIQDFAGSFGTIYGLVNNAGIYQRRRFSELNLRDWEDTITTNLTGTFLCTKAALPLIPDGGRIVNVASVLAHMGSGQGAHYAASKAGMIGFSKSLARELAPRGITVNVVAPGATDTDIIANDTPEKRKERERTALLGRVGQPQEIADVVLYLLSDRAGYITGETININGGMWMV